MAKAAKNKRRTPSIHSRAARRAGSPSLNLDKSLKTVTTPKADGVNPFAVQNGRIKKHRAKQMSRNQKIRLHKGLERADIVKDQMELKVQKSFGRLKKVRERRKDWDELNAKSVKNKSEISSSARARLRENTGDVHMSTNDEVSQSHKETESISAEGSNPTGQIASLPLRLPTDIPLPPAGDDEIE